MYLVVPCGTLFSDKLFFSCSHSRAPRVGKNTNQWLHHTCSAVPGYGWLNTPMIGCMILLVISMYPLVN